MLTRLQTWWSKELFQREVRKVFATRPISVRPSGLAFVSMVGNDDIAMYLLALKSAYRRIGAGHVAALVSRTMPGKDVDTIREHVSGIEIVIREDVDTGVCQKGGCWERIAYIVARAQDAYVVQLDADTLTFGPDMQEVLDCVRDNVGFALSGSAVKYVHSMQQAAVHANESAYGGYIGVVAERAFAGYPDNARLRYIRGSAAFSGFAKGQMPQARLMEFHERMAALVGPRWTEWGTEQCASNFMVANADRAIVLPHPKYANFWPGVDRDAASFLHFVGSYRYQDGFYRGKAAIELARLDEAGQPRP